MDPQADNSKHTVNGEEIAEKKDEMKTENDTASTSQEATVQGIKNLLFLYFYLFTCI